MKTDKLANAIGEVPDELIQEAEYVATKMPLTWVKWVAAAAACLLLAAVIAISMQTPQADEADDSIVAEEPTVVDEPATDSAGDSEGSTPSDEEVHMFDPTSELSEDDIACLVNTLQNHIFYDGEMGWYTGYRTDSTELEIAGPFPRYYLDSDGTLQDNPGKFYIIFDDDVPVIFAGWSVFTDSFEEIDNSLISMLDVEGRAWEGGVTTTVRAVIEGGATELAFVSGSDETLLVADNELYETEFVLPAFGLHPIKNTEATEWPDDYDPDDMETYPMGFVKSDGSPAYLAGLEFGSLDHRQTFEYQSPA